MAADNLQCAATNGWQCQSGYRGWQPVGQAALFRRCMPLGFRTAQGAGTMQRLAIKPLAHRMHAHSCTPLGWRRQAAAAVHAGHCASCGALDRAQACAASVAEEVQHCSTALPPATQAVWAPAAPRTSTAAAGETARATMHSPFVGCTTRRSWSPWQIAEHTIFARCGVQ